MAEFLTTQGCSYYVDRIVREATEYVYLVSPYLDINRNLFDLIDYRSGEIDISIIYGKKQRQPKAWDPQRNDRIRLFFKRNMHGKCYANESLCLVSSLNLLTYSEVNNIEFGLLIKKEDDSALFSKIAAEVNILMRSSELQRGKVDKFGSPIDKYSMGELAAKFAKRKIRPEFLVDETAGNYKTICNLALRLHHFKEEEVYKDKSSIYRGTRLGMELFSLIEREIEDIFEPA